MVRPEPDQPLREADVGAWSRRSSLALASSSRICCGMAGPGSRAAAGAASSRSLAAYRRAAYRRPLWHCAPLAGRPAWRPADRRRAGCARPAAPPCGPGGNRGPPARLPRWSANPDRRSRRRPARSISASKAPRGSDAILAIASARGPKPNRCSASAASVWGSRDMWIRHHVDRALGGSSEFGTTIHDSRLVNSDSSLEQRTVADSFR